DPSSTGSKIVPEGLQIPVARAVRQLQGHPRVKGLDVRVDGAMVAAIVQIDTNLPNRWRARGRSDNGVLAVEPVTFVFTEGFPVEVPLVFLRMDFDRSHPHLQPGDA